MFDKNFLKGFLSSKKLEGEEGNLESAENNERYNKAAFIIDQVINNSTDKFKNVL